MLEDAGRIQHWPFRARDAAAPSAPRDTAGSPLKRAVAATVANGTRGIAIARSLVAATSHQLGSGADIHEAIAKLVPLTPKEVPGVVYEV